MASDHEPSGKFHNGIEIHHLQTYSDHSQSFTEFYLDGKDMASDFTPWHHLISHTVNC